MVKENLKSKLPGKDKKISRFFNGCNSRKKFVKDTEGHYMTRLEKAKHDLSRARADFNDGCWDWTIIKAYYAIHHAANCLLSYKRGVFSKDHACLIIALKYYDLVGEGLFKELNKIDERFSDILSLDITFQLRKIGQYGVDEWKELDKRHSL